MSIPDEGRCPQHSDHHTGTHAPHTSTHERTSRSPKPKRKRGDPRETPQLAAHRPRRCRPSPTSSAEASWGDSAQRSDPRGLEGTCQPTPSWPRMADRGAHQSTHLLGARATGRSRSVQTRYGDIPVPSSSAGGSQRHIPAQTAAQQGEPVRPK